MANVTFGRNTPTPYDIRMEAKRALMRPPTNVGGIGGLFNNLKNAVSSPQKAGNALSGFLGGTIGAVASAYNTPDTSPVGTNQANFNRWRSENRFRTPPNISATDTGRGLANLPQGYARDELLLSANADGSSGLRNFGANYKNRELSAGQAAENFRTGAGFPGQSPAAERAYQQQLSSTAQQVAQDPQLDDFAKQRALDVASKDYSKSEDMGMRIWAQKYGPGSKNDLASKVKPGQAGYDVIQSVINKQTTPTPTFNPYAANIKLPGLEEYANSMQGAIVHPLEGAPMFAMNDPRFGGYESTVKEAYNLTNAFPSVTTQQTLSLPVGTYPVPNMSAYGGGIYPGEPLKIPFQYK
jgi:hypothetical protein